jgi:hypothetical protein
MKCLTEQEIRDRYYQDGIEDGKKEGYKNGFTDMWLIFRSGEMKCNCKYNNNGKCESSIALCPIARTHLKDVG